MAEEDVVGGVVDLHEIIITFSAFLRTFFLALDLGPELLRPLDKLFLKLELIVVIWSFADVKGAVELSDDI